jgi:hypothetical protein
MDDALGVSLFERRTGLLQEVDCSFGLHGTELLYQSLEVRPSSNSITRKKVPSSDTPKS